MEDKIKSKFYVCSFLCVRAVGIVMMFVQKKAPADFEF